jgi:hypothetical protein
LERKDLESFYGVDYLICEALCPESMSEEYG